MIKLSYDVGKATWDLAGKRAMVQDRSIFTGVLISLLTERGTWWGAQFAKHSDAWGSDLWSVLRSRRDSSFLARVSEAARESLEWIILNGFASNISVRAEEQDDRLALLVEIARPEGVTSWEILINEL